MVQGFLGGEMNAVQCLGFYPQNEGLHKIATTILQILTILADQRVRIVGRFKACKLPVYSIHGIKLSYLTGTGI